MSGDVLIAKDILALQSGFKDVCASQGWLFKEIQAKVRLVSEIAGEKLGLSFQMALLP